MKTIPCRKCNQPIGFLTNSRNGHRIPVNSETTQILEERTGNLRGLVDHGQGQGSEIAGRLPKTGEPHWNQVLVEMYRLHAQTCAAYAK